MSGLLKFMGYFEKTLVVCVTSVMAIALFLQVTSRYVFNFSITWAEEISLFGMIWLAYFGSAMAVTQRKHIRITLIPDMFSPKVQKTLDIINNFVFMAIMCLLIYGTYNMTVLAYETGQVAAATRLPRWIVICGLPVAFSFNLIRLIQDTHRCFGEYAALSRTAA